MKRFAITSIILAAMTISIHSSAQVRLGLGASTRLTSAASVNTPRINNALRATTATSASAASKTSVAAKTTAKTAGSEAKATATETKSASASTSTNAGVTPQNVHAAADVKVKAN
jgi:hypothetical protein